MDHTNIVGPKQGDHKVTLVGPKQGDHKVTLVGPKQGDHYTAQILLLLTRVWAEGYSILFVCVSVCLCVYTFL